MKHIKQTAFTLVELIVVITILSILATVAFISFQGYTTQSRDTVRVNNLALIDRGINLGVSQGKKLPTPENGVELFVSGSLYGYQGDFTPIVGSLFGLTDKIIDPVSGEYFSYSTNVNYSSYSISTRLEGNLLSNNIILDNLYAEQNNIIVEGGYVGIIYKDNEPIHKDTIIQSNGSIDIANETDTISAYFGNNSEITDIGENLSYIYNLKLQNQELFLNDENGIAYFDFKEGLDEKFQNYTIENTSNIGLIQDKNNTVLQCNGEFPIQIGVGENLLGGRNEFSVYTKYKVEKGENNSYNIIYASRGDNNSYNFKAQHDFTDIDNPSIQISTQKLDNDDVIGSVGYHIPISYGKYHSFLFTSKNGEWSVIFDGKIVNSGKTQGNIFNHASSTGMGLCGRYTTGYTLNAMIEKYYLSRTGVNHSGAMALYNLLDK